MLDEADIELPDLLTDLAGPDPAHAPQHSRVSSPTAAGWTTSSATRSSSSSWPPRPSTARKRLAIVDGIKYQRIGDEHYYAQELFEQEELTGYLKNMLECRRSRSTSTWSTTPAPKRTFADELEKNEAVKVYAKLPGWFKVPTPLGTYNPDWAVLVEKDGAERLYFVVETKSSLFADDLREPKQQRFDAARPTSKRWPSATTRLVSAGQET